jgi:PhnB protein
VQLATHLSFDGQCEEAFREYGRIFGSAIVTMLKYGESPMAPQVDPKWHNRIVHSSLKLGDFELAGADVLPHDYKKPQGFSVILTVEDNEEARRIFDSLAEGGQIGFPFEATFWSAGFGMVVDRFSVPWEVNCAKPPDNS